MSETGFLGNQFRRSVLINAVQGNRYLRSRHRVGDAGGGVACLVGEAERVYGEQSVITDIGGARNEQDAVGETSSQPDHRLLRRSFQRPSSPYLSGCSTFGRGSSAASS